MKIQLNNSSIPDRKPQKTQKNSAWDRFDTILNKDISFNSFGAKEKELFFHDLFVLYSSGLDLRSALIVLRSEKEEGKLADLIIQIEKQVIAGVKLSEAINTTGKFDTYEVISVKIGEESGNLTEVFKELSDYFKKQIALKKQFVSVVSYPLFVLTVSLGIVWFMLAAVVPMFVDVFARLNGELPSLTKWVVNLSEGVKTYGIWVVMLVIGAVIVLYSQRKTQLMRIFSAKAILALPVLGRVVHQVHLNRFSLAMKMMLSSNTPVLQAVELTHEMTSFYPLKKALGEIRESLFNGESLNASMETHSFFPKRMIVLISVGEEVNKLNQIFEKITEQLTNDIAHRTEMLGKVLEPVMIIFIGVFVGFILVAMYLPLFELSTTF